MKIYKKQLGIKLLEAFLLLVVGTGSVFAGMVIIAGLGITAKFLIS